jgi:D-glycero-alpha-D-manno-heptose-7-phosphate kinase
MSGPQRPLVAAAPTRLDFGGGWTDVPPYADERGGFVCNVAITRYATARVGLTPARFPSVGRPAPVGAALIEAALRRHGRDDLSATLTNDFPVGAGLGGSSAAGVALTAALRAFAGLDTKSDESRDAIAEESRALEVEELGIAGGRQDHYAAAYGGALALDFGARTVATRIELSNHATSALEEQCVVAYTGESRISAETITAVIDAYRARDARVIAALDRMKALAQQMPRALANGDVPLLAALVDEHWVHQKALHPAITTDRIESIEQAARAAGAIGLKALGASGGGCMIIFARTGEQKRVSTALAALSDVLPWRVAIDGVVVREETGVIRGLSPV